MNNTPEGTIEQIWQNLQDRYRNGFPIVKELIQNADDADATQLHLGWVKQLSAAKHALLQGPLLLLVNNGKFTEQDARAINSMGLSNKAGDRFSIGKFGLGLKSIFHLCETFFFISNTDEVRYGIVNPWADGRTGRDEFHQGWDEKSFSEEDRQLIATFLANIIEAKHYLCLLIPLRQEKQLQGCTPIIDHFPGDSDKPPAFFDEDIEIRMAYGLPMLRSLSTITGWLQSQGDDARLDEVFNITLRQTSQRRRYRPGHQITTDKQLPLGGWFDINSSRSGRSGSYQFSGLEMFLGDGDPIIKKLHSSEKWRKRSILNRETRDRKDFVDKADPHCAVYFTELATHEDASELAISKAVFLPTDDVSLAEKIGQLLTLHGYYFLDPGRTEIEGWNHEDFTGTPENEHVLQREWNGRLAQQGTLPLILPALKQFTEQADLPDKKILALTEALKSSDLFSQYCKYICTNHQWICCVNSGEESWQLLSADDKVLEIPRSQSKDDPNRPFQTLPALKNIKETLTYPDMPRLSPRDHTAKWPEELLLQVLEIPDAGSLFEHSVRLKYLVDFIEYVAPSIAGTSTIEERIIALSQRGFREQPLSLFAQNNQVKAQLRELLGLITEEQKLILDFGSQNLETTDLVFKALAELELPILVVPSILTKEGNQRQEHQISLEIAQTMLTCLAGLQSIVAGFEDLRSEISLQIIKVIDANYRSQLLRQCGDLKLFRGKSLRENQFVSLSLNELRVLAGRKTLFTWMDDGGTGLAFPLQANLAEATVVLITKKVVDEVLDIFNVKISACDVASCIQTLATIPKLHKTPKRQDLVTSLLTNPLSNQLLAKKCVRYLLHGIPSEFENTDIPLLIDKQQDNIWAKIAREALILAGADWRLLPEILTAVLNDNHRQILDVRAIDQQIAERLLKQVGPERITLPFSVEECDLLLDRLEDEVLTKHLRIHKTVGSQGKLVTITSNSYLESNFNLDDGLLQQITVLARNPKKKLEARQLELLGNRVLGPEQAITIALGQTSPVRYYQVIIDAFEQVEKPDGILIKRLKESKWLPSAQGIPVAPTQILYISGLEDDIERLVSGTRTEIFSENQLREDVRQHKVFKKIRSRLFPDINEALLLLGELMAEDNQLHMGPIEVVEFDLDNSQDTFKEFVNLFDPMVLPACTILTNVLKNVRSSGTRLSNLLEPLLKEIPPDRIVEILSFLSTQHQGVRRNKDRDLIFRFHKMYLDVAVNQQSFSELILPQIKLLNRQDEWHSTTRLCFDTEGIANSVLLNRDQENLIKSVIRTNTSRFDDPGTVSLDKTGQSLQKLDEEFVQAAQKLETYFRRWSTIDPEIIGGFLCVLGDQPEIKEKANLYLRKRTVPETRRLFKWPDIDDAMKRWRYTIEIVPANVKTQIVRSLVDQPFEAPLRTLQDLETIFVEDQQRLSITRIGYHKQRFQYYRLRLREIDPTILPPKKLSELLRTSTQKLFYVFYDQPNIDLTRAWENLDRSEQLDINVAQRLLLNSAFFYLRPFGIHTQPQVGPIFRQWEDARHREAELRYNQDEKDIDLSASLYPITQKMDRAEAQFRELLVNNEEIQDLILNALRKKVGQFTYKPHSIPFEIFQNADDAVLQLEKMVGSKELSDTHRRFVVGIDGQSLYFIHWGRPINDFQRGSFDKGRELGYHQDLEKMLVLSYSDKSVELDTGSVTGKFGLGFKSVFLATDSPQVVSGRLDFRVVGGVYPERLDSGEVDGLNTLLGDSRQHKGTIIALPVLPKINIQQDILQNFSELVHILLVFSRRIKRYELENQTYNVTWKEKKLLNLDNVFIGDIKPAGKKGLVFRSEPVISGETIYGSAVLLQVGSDGVHPLPDDIPPVWVTAPTKRVAGFGFAVNSLFDIDPGRAQLDTSSPKNKEIAKAMGDDLGESLCQLFDAASPEIWADFQKSLGMKNIKPYDFWHSLWDLLGNTFNKKSNGSELRELLHLVLWGTEEVPGGMSRLLTNRPALPTGLDFDAYRCLTKIEPGKALFIAKGTLENEETFASVSTWPTFAEKVSPGRIISSQVHKTLAALLPNQLEFEDYKLHRAIGEEIPRNGHINPELAVRLGVLVTRKFLSELDTSERDEVLKQFEVSQVKFLGQDKNYHPARELLVSTATTDDLTEDEKRSAQDEQLRAKFAPKSRLLFRDYSGQALDFFRACRQRLEADAKTMTPWALAAKTREKQLGVLWYLLTGRLRLELAESLKSEIKGSWLKSLTDDQLRDNFGFIDVNHRSMILALLGLLREQESEDKPRPEPVRRQTVQSVLHQIYNWWQREKAILTQEYEQDTFPGWYSPEALNLEVLNGNPQSRQSWLALFMLGSSHTMGYFSPQSHRNFLDLCQNNGWWDIFSNPDATAEDWIGVLDKYLEHKIEEEISYQHWMKQFVYIYQIATGLSEYSGAFLEINKEPARFNLTDFTRLKSSARFGGGSYAASRIDRTLGAGACFVIRELVRNDAVSSKTAYEHCYTPIKRVRDCFFELGCKGLDDTTNVNNSRIMYQFLSEHLGDERKITFDKSFDLPFLMISKRWETVKGFLDYHKD